MSRVLDPVQLLQARWLIVGAIVMCSLSLGTRYWRAQEASVPDQALATTGGAEATTAAAVRVPETAISSTGPPVAAARPAPAATPQPLPALIGVLLGSDPSLTRAFLRLPSGVVRSGLQADEIEDGLFVAEVAIDHVIVFREPEGWIRLDLVAMTAGGRSGRRTSTALAQAYMQAPVVVRAPALADPIAVQAVTSANYGGGRQGTLAKLRAMRAAIPNNTRGPN